MTTSPDVPPSASSGDDTVLYFVRHGETEYNRNGIMQGSGVDSVLNDTGVAQAHALADRFASLQVDAIYSSPLRRASQTADVLASPHEPVRRVELADLREMSWGIYEGEPPSESRNQALDDLKSDWQRGIYDRTVEGGESIMDVRQRAVRAARHIVDAEAGRTVVVVTHGRYLRVLLASICDGYDLSHMSEMGHANTCVNRVVFRDGRFTADLLNCTAHLAAA